MRSLVLATAGPKGHGKSTFIKVLTGIDPNKPQERPTEDEGRGMSLDLGVVHRKNISFIDTPGDSTLVKDFIAGLNNADGVLLFVSLKDGPQELTRTYLKIAIHSGITQILFVFTYADSLTTYASKKAVAEKVLNDLRDEIPAGVNVDFWIWDTHLEEPTYEKLKSFFRRNTKVRYPSYPRFFIDKAFETVNEDVVITGTFGEGKVAEGLRCLLYSPALFKPAPVAIGRIQSGTLSHSLFSQMGRVSFLFEGATLKHIKPGSFLILEDATPPFATHLALDLNLWDQLPQSTPVFVQYQSLTVEGTATQHAKGFWKVTLKRPLPVLRGDKVFIYLEGPDNTLASPVGAGTVLDAFLPKKVIKEAIPSFEDQKGFISWVESYDPPKDLRTWAERLGTSQEVARGLLDSKVKKSPNFDLDDEAQDLEERILKEGWLAYLNPSDKSAAQALIKAERLVLLKANHYLHVQHLQKVLDWLSQLFDKNQTLSLTDAKEFFQVSRSSYADILDFCERVHLIFKKGTSWQPFKMIKTWDSSRVQPSGARASEKRSGRPTSRY